MSRVVEGLVNRRHHHDTRLGVETGPLVRKALLYYHVLNLGRVILMVHKVSLVACRCVCDVCTEEDVGEWRVGGFVDGFEKVDGFGAALLVED